MEIFFKFLESDKGSFSFDDFTLSKIKNMDEVGVLWKQAKQVRADVDAAKAEGLEEQAVSKLPSITLDVEFSYEETDLLAPIARLILDLDPSRRDALLVCNYAIGRPRELYKACEESSVESIAAFARKHMKFFSRTLFAIDKQDRTNVQEIEICPD